MSEQNLKQDGDKAESGAYVELLNEIEVLAKSMTASDEDENEDDDEKDDDAIDNEEDEKEEEEEFGKSFTLTLENGEEIDAVDGTELVKSLIARIDTNESAQEKALRACVSLIGKQGELIKSLQGEVKKLASSGRGRRAVLSVTDKETVAKSQTGNHGEEMKTGMEPREFMAKAIEAQGAGKITGSDVAIAESYLNHGQAVPERIVRKVLA